jgi:hypothetical protein
MKNFFLLAMALLCTACHRTVTCRSEYLYPLYLASQQVNTPDPKRECFRGQQIITSWSLPKKYWHKPVELHLNVRYGNRELATFTHGIDRPAGWWVYTLLNEDYLSKCGILSFQAQLVQNCQVIGEWNHFLWTPIIELK